MVMDAPMPQSSDHDCCQHSSAGNGAEAYPRDVLIRCFLRSYCILAGMNPRGLQGLGFAFAAMPGLSHLYGETPERDAAVTRCARRFNCHPFFGPLALGIYLHTEGAIASGSASLHDVENIRETAFNTLSALGDTFFGGAVTVTWVLLVAILLVCGWFTGAAAVTLVLFVGLQAMKWKGFLLGIRHGLGAFARIRQLDPARIAEGLRYGNAVLVALFIFCALVAGGFLPGLPLFFLASSDWAGYTQPIHALLAPEWLYAGVSAILLGFALPVAMRAGGAGGTGGATLRIVLCFAAGAGIFATLFFWDIFG